MKDRLHKIMEAEGLSPAKFADEIGVQRSSISHIISGRNKPSYDFIILGDKNPAEVRGTLPAKNNRTSRSTREGLFCPAARAAGPKR